MATKVVRYSVYIASRRHGELGLEKIHGPYLHRKDADQAAEEERKRRSHICEVSVRTETKKWISLESGAREWRDRSPQSR